VAIIGGGISGLATAYMLMRTSDLRVAVLEAGLAGHGATGNNGGQAVEGTEAGFREIASIVGEERAVQGFRELAGAMDELDRMVGKVGPPGMLAKVAGRMGIADQGLLEQRIEDLRARRAAGLDSGKVHFADDALIGLQAEGPREPRALLARQLWSKDQRYIAFIEMRMGLINTWDLVEKIASHLRSEAPERFSIYERSPARLLRLSEEDVTIGCNGRIMVASSAVLCTNGYLCPRIEACSPPFVKGKVKGVVGYMVGFEDGSGPEGARAYFPGGKDYYYLSRKKTRTNWLTAVGGPEGSISGEYDEGTVYHPDAYSQLGSFISSTLGLSYPPARRWQGLMGYTSTGIRIAGQDPRLPALYYNMGCNGIGILSALAGARRLADDMGGEDQEPSMFDPEAMAGARITMDGHERAHRP